MNMYAESSLFSGKKGAALMAVILLHLVFGYAFYKELAAKIGMKLAPPPLNLRWMETPRDTIKPPPAVPLMAGSSRPPFKPAPVSTAWIRLA